MKRISIFIIFLLLVAGGFAWVKYRLLATKDFTADERKKRSPIDLRPQLIAKLQQLVKDGSDGLYTLSIGSLEPDLMGATLHATDVNIKVDSEGFNRLQQQQKLPDDLFAFSIHSVHISGLGLEDLLHTKKVALQTIKLDSPEIAVWHKDQPYNSVKRQVDSQLTLYQKLTKQLDRIAIDTITLSDGTFTDNNANANKQIVLKEFSVQMDNLLVDSSTQYDHTRFLFARHASFATKNYSSITTDSLYEFRIGNLNIEGEKHQLEANDVSFKPRGSRQWFESRLKTRQEMFTIHIPTLRFWDVNWWDMLHRKTLVAQKGAMEKASINIYLNRELPKGKGLTIDNFPQQLLAKMDAPISFKEFDLQDLDLTYIEQSPQTHQAGTVRFTAMNAKAMNVTNIPGEIKTNKQLTVDAEAQFMGKWPMSARFIFNLLKTSSGSFTASLKMGAMNGRSVNGFAEPLGQVSITSGELQSAKVEMAGNNHNINGKVTAAYTGLRIATLKNKKDSKGQLKTKKTETLLAGVLVKKNNPGNNGNLRTEQFNLDRGQHPNFFNFLWSAIKMGLLKTVGIPPGLGM